MLAILFAAAARKSRALLTLMAIIVPAVFVLGAGIHLTAVGRHLKFSFAKMVGILLLGISFSGIINLFSLTITSTCSPDGKVVVSPLRLCLFWLGELVRWVPAMLVSWYIFMPTDQSSSRNDPTSNSPEKNP